MKSKEKLTGAIVVLQWIYLTPAVQSFQIQALGQVLSLCLIRIPAHEPGKTVGDGSNILPFMWETQKEFQTPGFDVAWAWMLWPFGKWTSR